VSNLKYEVETDDFMFGPIFYYTSTIIAKLVGFYTIWIEGRI
jgi:hypothetical protein